MIDIYTEKKNSKDWILKNDLYFNLNTSNEEMSKEEIELIREVQKKCQASIKRSHKQLN